MTSVDTMVRVTGLRKAYNAITAVDGVSFEIRQGEIFGLLGPNGAGKTTTISILAGILKHDGGEIELSGRAFSGALDMKRLLGIVPQELAIYPKLTGRENLEFFGALYGQGGSALRARVNQMLELVGLTDRGESRADTYSGGMKRRLNLAVGLMHNPRLLLLDEPTVGVDPQSRNHIFEGVRELNRQGLTVLYTSHYMEEVQSLCDRVGIMDRGRLVACDTVYNLITGQGRAIIEIGLDIPEIPQVLLDRLTRVEYVHSAHLSDPVGAMQKTQAATTLSASAPLRHRVEDRNGYSEETDAEVSAYCLVLVRTDQPHRALAGLVTALAAADLPLRSLNIKQPNLEDVFLALTGKTLRD